MYNIFFSIGKTLKSIKEELDSFFDYIRDHKENRIVISSEPPKFCEIGDIWIDLQGQETIWTDFKEIAVDCNLMYSSLDEISNTKNPNYIPMSATVILPETEYVTYLTIGESLDTGWIGYFKANYGKLEKDLFLDGFINLIAANLNTNEIWFEALGDYVREAKYVNIGFPDIGVVIYYNGIKDNGVVSEKGFYNDVVVNERVVNYLKENINKTIPITVEIKTEF